MKSPEKPPTTESKPTKKKRGLGPYRRPENLEDPDRFNIARAKIEEKRGFIFRRDFSDGVAVVTDKTGWQWFTVNEDGIRTSEKYDHVDRFSGGVAVVRKKSKKSYIGLNGQRITGQWFDSASPFKEGLGAVEQNNECFFINREGKKAFDKVFDRFEGVGFHNGFADVVKGNKRLLINKEGKTVASKEMPRKGLTEAEEQEWFDKTNEIKINRIIGGKNKVKKVKAKVKDVSTDAGEEKWFDEGEKRSKQREEEARV